MSHAFQPQDWVDAILEGEATVKEPPNFLARRIFGESSQNITQKQSTLSLLSGPRSEDRTSIRKNDSLTSSRRSTSLASRSNVSSFAAGSGYYAGKGLRWLGRVSLVTIESCVWAVRLNVYKTILKEWQSLLFSENNMDDVFPGLDIASYRLLSPEGPGFKDNFQDIISIVTLHICARILRNDQILGCDKKMVADLTWQVAILRDIIRHRELNSEPSTYHPELGVAEDIRRIFHFATSLHTIPPVIIAIHTLCGKLLIPERQGPTLNGTDAKLFKLLTCSLQRYQLPEATVRILRELASSRRERRFDALDCVATSYQVAIFCICSELDPLFEEIFSGPQGISALMEGLDFLLKDIETGETAIPWLEVLHTIHALHDIFLLLCKMRALVVPAEVTVHILRCLIRIFGLRIPWPIKTDIRGAVIDAISALLLHSQEVFPVVLEEEWEATFYFVGRLRGMIRSASKEVRKAELQSLADRLLALCGRYDCVGEVYTILSSCGSLIGTEWET
ncbi:hypothetical protein M422DRAFT_48637 [Sphaerobolus stellatus SS14]|uniref:Uncharacterized protein n=1 Tax=Sphaerobolus stellatus (strain SS14) TaxID=990650 RepID=A0A0C9UEJ7_SPHS4|nr:hypothetical protein M422DRAFT_48637 [Sphaerobolus stellatus SS14]